MPKGEGEKPTLRSNYWLATSRFPEDFTKSVLFCTELRVGKVVKAKT